MNVSSQLQMLVELQQLDSEIAERENIKESIPLKIEEEEKKFEVLNVEFQNKKKEKEVLERDLRSKERKLQTVEENLKKFSSKLYEIKTQKELEAFDQEVQEHKKEKSRLEEKIIQLMERIEELTEEIQQKGRVVNELAQKLAETKEKYNIEAKENTDRLQFCATKRQTLASKINKDLLSYYEKLRKNKDNLAVVPIKDEACQGCFTILPPQVINEVKMASQIIKCERCVRILYWKDEDQKEE
jgi:hypothetical protein